MTEFNTPESNAEREREMALRNWRGVSVERFDEIAAERGDLDRKVTELSAQVEGLREALATSRREHAGFEAEVRSAIKEWAEEDGWERSTMNERLSSLDLDPFTTRVTATISTTVEVEFITDRDPDDIDDDYILGATALRVDADSYATAEDLSVEDTGDWNVDRFNTEEN